MRESIFFWIFIILMNSKPNFCDVITKYNGSIFGGKTISECVNGSRKAYSDLEISTSELTKREGYSAEEHVVITEDGYLLTVHRIPGATGAPTVFLLHGVTQSSFDWVVTGKDYALAFLLSDQGYDVWMGNMRGNFYSRCHSTIDPSNRKFWDFSFHEMGMFDLPATIEYIKSVTTQERIIYIGHSMGATQFFVMATEKPEFTANNVKAMFSLAPAVFNYHLRGLGAYSTPTAHLFTLINQYQNHGEIFANDFIWKLWVKYGCGLILTNEICEVGLFFVIGFDPDLIDVNKIPLFFNHFPMGTSSKSFDHLGQGILKNVFRQYNYGKIKNLRKYNSSTPPDYDLTKVKVPVGIFYGANDYLSNQKDIEHLWNHLPHKIIKYQVPFKKFNHFDFLWANKARDLVYKKLLTEMKKF